MHVAVGAVATLIILGLLAAGFALSAGGSPEEARTVVERAVESESEESSRPASVWAGPLRLPTPNIALFKENGGPQYYQQTARFERGIDDGSDEPLEPWQSGQYGFVRSPIETDAQGIVYTRFHEGIDIQAMGRDDAGEPTDTVHAVGAGRVAYVNNAAGGSNYGRYVVVEHDWGGAPYYSLYAHLSEATATEGARVRRGDPVGFMGYTGAGINRARAHTHFEFNLLINDQFQRWINRHFGGNAHGIYSGLNMRGWNAAEYFEALRDNPDLTPPEYIQTLDPYYKVAFPRDGPLDLLTRYPWMRPEGVSDTTQFPGWEMSFTRGGFPIDVEPYEQEISEPQVTQSPPMQGVSCRHSTYEHLQGTPPNCTLAPRGRRYIDLITTQAAGEASTRAW